MVSVKLALFRIGLRVEKGGRRAPRHAAECSQWQRQAVAKWHATATYRPSTATPLISERDTVPSHSLFMGSQAGGAATPEGPAERQERDAHRRSAGEEAPRNACLARTHGVSPRGPPLGPRKRNGPFLPAPLQTAH
ncbi:hypothetical protein SKAU_G00200160 [Synaphobranchus kaupii]|uniref:Uncharacterized protein n=1 Tax=Synaphobranchus kaupii TaxID=118154 RepID=A0A9Q1FFB8_SYNKA|nr:hypothetical protein SKAU_G00200160 [Synaphobranchus kaupii]